MNVLLYWSQQLRYGERTARGIVGGYKNCWALVVLGERRREMNSKRKIVSRDMVRDIVSSRASATSGLDRKKQQEGWLLAE